VTELTKKGADGTNSNFAGVEAAARNGFPTLSLTLSEFTTVGRGVDDQTLSYAVWNSLRVLSERSEGTGERGVSCPSGMKKGGINKCQSLPEEEEANPTAS